MNVLKEILLPSLYFSAITAKNHVEPDVSVICDKTKITDKGCDGAPDWIIEIVSPGSRNSFDEDIPAGIYDDFSIRIS